MGPTASSPCSASFQTRADLPAWPAAAACPATGLPAVPASACAAAKTCPDLPTSSTSPAAELPASAATAAARGIPKPCATEAAAEHSGSANTAEFPASASATAATADLPASAEIPASSRCSSAADGRPGHRLWGKPFQPDQHQQQLCPVRRPVWRVGARGAGRRPAFQSDLLPAAAASGAKAAAFHCFWFDCPARRLCLRPLVRPVPVLSPMIIYLSNLS